jgi:hypothetical protein
VGDLERLFDEIDALLADPASGDIALIERTLTDGYAQALSLEAERWRVEKRIGEVAATLDSGDASAKAKELTTLAKRLESSDGDLSRLRAVLADLRRVADAVRV